MNIYPPISVKFWGMEFQYGTIFMTWVAMTVLVVLFYLGSRKLKMVPGRAQALLELIVEAFQGLCENAMGAERGRKYVPYVGTMFLFIWTCNMMGLVPFRGLHVGNFHLPAFQEPTRNIATPVAMGLVMFLVAHASGIRAKGLWKYIKSYFEPIFIMAPLNIVSKFASLISISMRLFGNIFGGSVILLLVSGFVAYILLPVGLNFFFGIFVGTVQAFVFAVLTLTYTAVEMEEE